MTSEHTVMNHQGSPVSSPVPIRPSAASGFPPSPSGPAEDSSLSSSENSALTKPLWAPLETDVPVSLDTSNEVHVCQLCGCWYETRKGLSSHARAHLRHSGIPDGDIKGSAVDFLYRIMKEQNLKPVTTPSLNQLPTERSPRSSSKRPSDLTSPPSSPPSKRPKAPEDCTCMLCGDVFENRKGLGSHARSHLRQMGVTDLMGKRTAIETIEDLIGSGMLQPMNPVKTVGKPSWSVVRSATQASPDAPPLSPASGQCKNPSNSKGIGSSPTPINKAPKAKKGFRFAVDALYRKPKLEPVETDISGQPDAANAIGNVHSVESPAALGSPKTFNTDVDSPPTVPCEFCGQLFDTRKALSCHARAHLRQLGLTWSIKTSPIDLLQEVMVHGEEGRKGFLSPEKASPRTSNWLLDISQAKGRSFNNGNTPVNYSMKEKSPSAKSGASQLDASCELCGFNFENRKALASHARAHLRQLGIIEWRADGATSPIELLSELIRKDPVRVAAITRRYRMGDLYIKKSHRGAGSPSLSTDSDSVMGSSWRSELSSHRGEPNMTPSSSRPSQGHTHRTAANSRPAVRSPMGVHSPKYAATPGSVKKSKDLFPQQPPRSGGIPAMLPKPPLTPLVKLVGKVYSLKCRFCEEVFQGPLSVQEKWITHLQKHILTLGYKGKPSPPAAPLAAPAPALVSV